VSHAAPRAGDIRTSLACTRRMGERLGLVDTIALDAGLRALVAA
jgi:hypothetical protein